jgi:hypothetical protein
MRGLLNRNARHTSDAPAASEAAPATEASGEGTTEDAAEDACGGVEAARADHRAAVPAPGVDVVLRHNERVLAPGLRLVEERRARAGSSPAASAAWW